MNSDEGETRGGGGECEADTLVRSFAAAGKPASGQECPLHVAFRGFDEHADVQRRQRNLPHWQQPGTCYFITFRLGDALPQHLLEQWRNERAIWLRWNPEPWTQKQRDEYHAQFTERQDEWLDAAHGECHLRRAGVRELVRVSVMKFDGIRYDVDAFVLMPNHVHLLWHMREGFDLAKELKGLKGATARACNVLLGRTGTFWMDESYDRIVRDAEELGAFREYIARNPVSAGLKPHEFALEIFNRLETKP